MKLKLKLMFVALCMFLVSVSAYAFDGEDTYLVTFRDTAKLYGLSPNTERNYIVASSEDLSEYLDAGIVAEYEPNHKVELFGEWNLDLVNSDFASELGCLGNDVKVGVIDSGLYPFQELDDNVISGKNYIDNNYDTSDNIGHGTFVTGIIASESRGIAHRCKIIPLKCFDEGKDTYVDVLLNAIYDAVDVYDCDVINMSLGVDSYSFNLNRAVTYATNKGVIVVAAVGNDGNTVVNYPAGYSTVVGVGSVNEAKEKSWFSQYNSSVFVSAPGEDIISLYPGGLAKGSGTSFAAPHVTALAAVAKCIDNKINTTKFMNTLSATSEDLGTAGYDHNFGYGLVDFEKFILKQIEGREIFISPLYRENNKFRGIIYNNSEKKLNLMLTGASYNGDKFAGLDSETITLEKAQKHSIESKALGSLFKFMVWENSVDMRPLTEVITQE